MTSRLKSGRGNTTVRPRSKRETPRVTGSVKFPDKGSVSESSKSAGCSESEPTSSLVNRNEVADLLVTGGRLEHLS
ncbi:MAG: hypothetical protein ACUZ8O_08190 [Candidatus Anammoxibacter sp.]